MERDENVIYVGKKPLVNYIRAVMTQFTKKNSKKVIIKSRGKFISKAVDVAEVSKRTLAEQGVKIGEINISSEVFETSEKKTNISTMEIVLSKGSS